MTWAFDQPLAGNHKVVLLALCDRSNDDGDCFPGIPELARKAFISERTVQRVMLDLADQGYISFVSRFTTEGRQTSNRYLIHLDGGRVTECHRGEGDTVVTGEGDTVVTPYEPSEGTVTTNTLGTRAKKPKTQFPVDFEPNQATTQVIHEQNLSPEDVRREIAAMRDWTANAGTGARKSDWQAFARNWFRKSKPMRPSNGPTYRKMGSLERTARETDAVIEELERREIEASQRDRGGNPLALSRL